MTKGTLEANELIFLRLAQSSGIPFKAYHTIPFVVVHITSYFVLYLVLFFVLYLSYLSLLLFWEDAKTFPKKRKNSFCRETFWKFRASLPCASDSLGWVDIFKDKWMAKILQETMVDICLSWRIWLNTRTLTMEQPGRKRREGAFYSRPIFKISWK